MLLPHSGIARDSLDGLLVEFLSFVIMVPLAILSWRAIGAIFFSRNPDSRFARLIHAVT